MRHVFVREIHLLAVVHDEAQPVPSLGEPPWQAEHVGRGEALLSRPDLVPVHVEPAEPQHTLELEQQRSPGHLPGHVDGALVGGGADVAHAAGEVAHHGLVHAAVGQPQMGLQGGGGADAGLVERGGQAHFAGCGAEGGGDLPEPAEVGRGLCRGTAARPQQGQHEEKGWFHVCSFGAKITVSRHPAHRQSRNKDGRFAGKRAARAPKKGGIPCGIPPCGWSRTRGAGMEHQSLASVSSSQMEPRLDRLPPAPPV